MYNSIVMIVEHRNFWHKLRVEHIDADKWAVYEYFHGAVPYIAKTKDEAISKYLDDRGNVGFPIGSLNTNKLFI